MTDRRLAAIFAIQGVAFGLFMPFPVPLLAERGLGPAQIGLILGVAGLAALVAYPVWGAIADGWLGRPRAIALTGLTAAVGGVWILTAGSDPAVLTAALSVAMVGALGWGPLIDALTLDELGERSASYGRLRVWASIGWAASTAAGGWIWMQAGPQPVFGAFIVGSLLVAVLVLLPTASSASSASEPDTGDAAPRPSLRRWLPHLLAPVMLGFLLGLLITALGEHASWRFISLRILDQGGSVLLVGLAASFPALVEIPIFAGSRRLAIRLGLRWLFVVGALSAALLMALVAVAPEAWMVTTLRTLEGAPYALRYMAMVMIVGTLLPRHLYAMGQSVAWFVYAGIAPIIADLVGGLIYDVYGAPALFAAVTVALSLGGAVVWLVLRDPLFGPQREAPASAQAPVPEDVPVPLPEEVRRPPPVP